MYPVSQSKSWLQSSVGIVHFSSGGETPSWLYKARESGMLISEVYLREARVKVFLKSERKIIKIVTV